MAILGKPGFFGSVRTPIQWRMVAAVTTPALFVLVGSFLAWSAPAGASPVAINEPQACGRSQVGQDITLTGTLRHYKRYYRGVVQVTASNGNSITYPVAYRKIPLRDADPRGHYGYELRGTFVVWGGPYYADTFLYVQHGKAWVYAYMESAPTGVVTDVCTVLDAYT